MFGLPVPSRQVTVTRDYNISVALCSVDKTFIVIMGIRNTAISDTFTERSALYGSGRAVGQFVPTISDVCVY